VVSPRGRDGRWNDVPCIPTETGTCTPMASECLEPRQELSVVQAPEVFVEGSAHERRRGGIERAAQRAEKPRRRDQHQLAIAVVGARSLQTPGELGGKGQRRVTRLRGTRRALARCPATSLALPLTPFGVVDRLDDPEAFVSVLRDKPRAALVRHHNPRRHAAAGYKTDDREASSTPTRAASTHGRPSPPRAHRLGRAPSRSPHATTVQPTLVASSRRPGAASLAVEAARPAPAGCARGHT